MIAALIDVLIPESFFTKYLGNEYLEMLLILLAAVPLYVCATGSVPIAAMLMLKGLSPGAAIVFLMAGPATNAATITVLWKVFGKRTLFIYLISICTGAFLFGLLTNEFLPREWFTGYIHHFHGELHEHGFLPQWLQIGSSILLSLLIINALIRRYRINLFSQKTIPFSMINSDPLKSSLNNNTLKMKVLTIIVKGMTCNHCKATIEESIGKLPGINSVDADIITGKVKLTGDYFNLDQIRFEVESVGYNWGGVAE